MTVFVETGKVVTNIAMVTVASGIVGLILMAIAAMLWVPMSVIRETP